MPPRLLEGRHDLDHAVACGAAYYGWTQHCGGVRIRGGTARGYYVGIETAGLAIPGAGRPLRALCVVPIGMEEGTETDVPSEEIGLVVGESAQFRFFSSSTRKEDKPGSVLSAWTPDELEETDPLVATLPAAEEVEGDYVPVRFHSRITELGVLELWSPARRSTAGGSWNSASGRNRICETAKPENDPMLSVRTIVSGVRTLVYGGIVTVFVIRNAETRNALDAALAGGALADYLTWMIRSIVLLPTHLWHGCYDCCINLMFGWVLWRFARAEGGNGRRIYRHGLPRFHARARGQVGLLHHDVRRGSRR